MATAILLTASIIALAIGRPFCQRSEWRARKRRREFRRSLVNRR